jgi:hypothetical protein
LKLFICDHCGKSYSQEVYLMKHMEKHAEKKPDVKGEKVKSGDKRSKATKSNGEPVAKRSANRSTVASRAAAAAIAASAATANNVTSGRSTNSRLIGNFGSSNDSNNRSIASIQSMSSSPSALTAVTVNSISQSPIYLQTIGAGGYSHLSPVPHHSLSSSHQLGVSNVSNGSLPMFSSNSGSMLNSASMSSVTAAAAASAATAAAAAASMHVPMSQSSATLYSGGSVGPSWSMCKLDSTNPSPSMLMDPLGSHATNVESCDSPARYESIGEPSSSSSSAAAQHRQSSQQTLGQSTTSSSAHSPHATGVSIPTSVGGQSIESDAAHLLYGAQNMTGSAHSSAFTALQGRSPVTSSYPFAYDGFSFAPMMKASSSHQSTHPASSHPHFTHAQAAHHHHHHHHPHQHHPQLNQLNQSHHIVHQSMTSHQSQHLSHGNHNHLVATGSSLTQPLINATLPHLTSNMAILPPSSSSAASVTSQPNLGAQQQSHHQLIALNQIRNYAGAAQPISSSADRPVIMNNVIFGGSTHSSGNSCPGDYPIMII